MDFDFEVAMGRLAEISSLMAKNEISLDESLKLYNEAAGLVGKCEKYLDEAKLVVEQAEMKADRK